MERDTDNSPLIELGIASKDTLGPAPVGTPEQQGYFINGLSDE